MFFGFKFNSHKYLGQLGIAVLLKINDKSCFYTKKNPNFPAFLGKQPPDWVKREKRKVEN